MIVFLLDSSSLSSVLFSFLSFLVNVSFAEPDLNATGMVTNPPLLPPPPPPPPPPDLSPFKPSIAVLVGALTSVFSVTFLLLLYAKHCRRRNGGRFYAQNHRRFDGHGLTGRKNSGIDRTVIESLPVFRFGSLSGHMDGLECAVCLSRFEPTEVLRLLPKCKHAFHVECVDTWLDAHSTCPLCRYRVDPEDILLIGDCSIWHENPCSYQQEEENLGSDNTTQSGPDPTRPDPGYRRVSGTRYSAGERASRGFLKRPSESNTAESAPPCSCSSSMQSPSTASFRRSLDSSLRRKRETATVGIFGRPQRRDGLLLPDGLITDRESFERRFEHRIIISAAGDRDQRWSDVRPSDLLYLRSEMILSDCRRFAVGRARETRPPGEGTAEGEINGSGRGVINGRSASEITSMSREIHKSHRQRQAEGAVSRLPPWVSSQSHPGVRSHCTTGASLC